jgi:hypothetical protein
MEIMSFVKQLPQRLVYCGKKKSKSSGSVIKIPQLVVLSDKISDYSKPNHTNSGIKG